MRLNKSIVIEKAQKRLAGLEAIDPALDLGNGLTVTSFQAKIDALISTLDALNQAKASADGLRIDMRNKEKEMRNLVQSAREAVGFKYGYDSEQYVTVGGKRKSDRRKPLHKVNTKTA